jgi:hypothetical protein
MARDESFINLFPEIIYDKDQIGQISLDIWNNYKVIFNPKDTTDEPFLYHSVVSTDTIENLASKYYNDSRLWWVILVVNDVEDPFDFIQDVLNKKHRKEDRVIKIIKPNYIPSIIDRLKQIRSNMNRKNSNSYNNNEITRDT